MRLNRITRGLLASAAALVMLVLSGGGASAAHLVFEKNSLFGMSANAFSLGAPVAPSPRDTLAYLGNPAAIMDVQSANYTFSFGSMDSLLDEEGYSFTLFSYAKPHKDAWTVITSKDGDTERKMVTYTIKAGGTRTAWYGASVSSYKYETGLGNASGFSVDLGAMFTSGDKTRFGFTIKNMLSSVGTSDETAVGGGTNRQPMVIGVGVSHMLRENIRGYLNYQRFKVSVSEPFEERDLDFNSVYLGVEYLTGGKNASKAQMAVPVAAGTTNNYKTDDTDKMLMAGFDYRADNYYAGYSSMTKNNYYDGGSVLTLAYKQNGEWEAPPPAPAPAVATKTVAAPTATFEPPLSSKVKEPPPPELTNSLEDSLTDQGGGEDSSSGQQVPQPPIKKPVKPLYVDNVLFAPKAVLIPSTLEPNFLDVAGHWSEKLVKELGAAGFYAGAKSDMFSPQSPVLKEEFYRLVFLTQLNRVFSKPLEVNFTTEKPVRAVVTLGSPAVEAPIKLVSGYYEKAGAKRIVLERPLLRERLSAAGLSAGRYRLNVHLSGDENDEAGIEEQITVLDTSIDFSPVSSLQGEERKKKAEEIIESFSALGLNTDYLKSVQFEGNVTRIEAISALLTALNITPVAQPRQAASFSDISSLSEQEKRIVYTGATPLPSLEFKPLMGGYPDGTFRPNNAITNAETAALISRAVKIISKDLIPTEQPPAPVSVAPERRAEPQAANKQVPGTRPEIVPYQAAGQGSGLSVPAPTIRGMERISKTESKYQILASAPPPGPPVDKKEPPPRKEESPAPVPAGKIKRVAKIPAVDESATVQNRNEKFIVIAESYIYRQNAEEAVGDLRSKGWNADVLAERIGEVGVFHVVLGMYSTPERAAEAASAKISGYNLKVKRISVAAPALKTTPETAPKNIYVKPNVNERETILKMPIGDTSPANTNRGSYIMLEE